MTSQPCPLARQLAADHRPELSVERSQALDKLHGPSHAWDVSGLYESKFGVSVSFRVRAESLEEAREKVKELIEHGQAVHNADVQWDWA